MTDDQIISAMRSGETVNFGMNGRNQSVMDLMAMLEREGKIKTWDVSGSQETRRAACWINQT